MDNQNQVSIVNAVKDVRLVPTKSKSGNIYDRLVVEFYDGYKFSTPAFGDTGYILRKQAEYEPTDEL